MPKTIILICFLLVGSISTAREMNYITSQDGQLWDGDQHFRFLSFNVPNLLLIEDHHKLNQVNPYRLPNHFEIRDALLSIQQMGGRVVRLYALPVKDVNRPEDKPSYIESPTSINETAIATLDTILAVAADLNLRVIIPFIDQWDWMGGIKAYTSFYRKPKRSFWRNRKIINDYKKLLQTIITRINPVTGLAYKDDPTILCWETGNELLAPYKWTKEIAAWIKAIDPNHLVMDGYFAINWNRVKKKAISDPNVDILSSHHYEKKGDKTIRNILRNCQRIQRKKVYVIGEYGFQTAAEMNNVVDMAKSKPIAGMLLWSLRFHCREGGFYWHSEPAGRQLYRAYHWPGFDSGASYDEKSVFDLIKSTNEVDMPPPESPKLLQMDQFGCVNWAGVAGAESYILSRSENTNGPFEMIREYITDDREPFSCLFYDDDTELGKSYWYRLIAVNATGRSTPKIFGPFIKKRAVFVDECTNLDLAFKHQRANVVHVDPRNHHEQSSHVLIKSNGFLRYEFDKPISQIDVYSWENPKQPGLNFFSEGSTRLIPQINSLVDSPYQKHLKDRCHYRLTIDQSDLTSIIIQANRSVHIGYVRLVF